jgi:hypothetical protein
MKVASLSEKRADKDVVAKLRDFLEMAERGDLVAVAIVGGTAGKEMWMGRAGDQGVAMVGALEMMKARILAEL